VAGVSGRAWRGPFESRGRLRAALSAYAEYRLAGPAKARWEVSAWYLHAGALAAFYGWAAAERYARVARPILAAVSPPASQGRR